MKEYTPMMRHYLETKEKYKDCILFYRLGDFYEMFFDDAKIVSRELELTLTGKSCGMEERAPMCGVPYHAADTYINRLVKRGYKVAICEQLEDPKLAKGIVKRDVIRIVTPGTNTDAASLDETRNNYLLCICYTEHRFGMAFTDISTGEFLVTEVSSERKLIDEICKFMPSEIICNEALFMSSVPMEELRARLHFVVTSLNPSYFDDEQAKNVIRRHFNVQTTDALGLSEFETGTIAAGAALLYLQDTQKTDLSSILYLTPYHDSSYMILDASTRRNLELTETLRDKEKRGTLLWVLDHTQTAMGARFLRLQIEQPLIDPQKISARLDAVNSLKEGMIGREELREYLTSVYDLERLMTRITYKTANPRDLLAFASSLSVLPGIVTVLSDFDSDLVREIQTDIDPLEDLYKLTVSSISPDAPVTTHDGGIIRDGYSGEVDRLRRAKKDGKTWLADLETKEREKTGIKNLKIKYNRVFGYFLEVSNSNLDQVPDYFIRKQTLANAERFFTPELKELENTILGSEDRLTHLENELYHEILNRLTAENARIQKTAHAIARLDFLQSLAQAAEKNKYCCPTVNEGDVIDIKGGRHPVVEKMQKNELFIDNDTYLDNDSHRLSIITGPNMAGKSTYMRQCALIVLMAQIGSFVPAKEASIGVVDRIFTRVGASDDLASGQSTFMVEMNEVSNILRNATSRSLLILDEIGRGTSTYDGLAIAWAVVEHISNPKLLGAKTLFATHYHELTTLEGKLPGVRNLCIAVRENGEDIVFLRKIVPGGADKSYGIEVAKLAGLPESVVRRANEILDEISANDLSGVTERIASDESKNRRTGKEKKKKLDDLELNQISLFDTVRDEDIIERLSNMDITTMTPIEAMNTLNELINKVKNRW